MFFHSFKFLKVLLTVRSALFRLGFIRMRKDGEDLQRAKRLTNRRTFAATLAPTFREMGLRIIIRPCVCNLNLQAGIGSCDV